MREVEFLGNIIHMQHDVAGLNHELSEKEGQQRDYIVNLFKMHPYLKQWVENTSLFNAIKNDAKMGATIRYNEPNGSEVELDLNGKQINSAEELPAELVINFVRAYLSEQVKNNGNEPNRNTFLPSI